MGWLRIALVTVIGLFVLGAIFALTGVLAFEVLGGALLWVGGFLLLLAIAAAVALLLKSLLFDRERQRGGRLT